jgi:hypothetical protein
MDGIEFTLDEEQCEIGGNINKNEGNSKILNKNPDNFASNSYQVNSTYFTRND